MPLIDSRTVWMPNPLCGNGYSLPAPGASSTIDCNASPLVSVENLTSNTQHIPLNDHAQPMMHKDDVIQFKDKCIQQQIQMHSMQLEAACSEAHMKVRQNDLDCQAAIHTKETTIASMTHEIASLKQGLNTANQNQGLSNNGVNSQAAIDKDKLIEDQHLEIARLQWALTIACPMVTKD